MNDPQMSFLSYDYDDIESYAIRIAEYVHSLDLESKVSVLNRVRSILHSCSPFKNEPIDFVQWVISDNVSANDYNPNSVAPPEMQLLEHSIHHDGFTQPVVGWPDSPTTFEVVDGFHRTTVAKRSEEVKNRLMGFVPIVSIQNKNTDRNDRIASTIRHNRARGKHKVESMSDIVIELKKRNWSDNRIAKELGMDQDEVLRLCQITGLSDVFSDEQFSQAWDAAILDDQSISVIDESDVEAEAISEDRIFHEWQDWECFPAGFYSDKPPENMSVAECEEAYRDFLADIPRFESCMARVLKEWINSCEHYLTNEKMNRIAWLGQASMCIDTGIPSRFCGGYNLLSHEQKEAADKAAHKYLNIWMVSNGRSEISWEDAQPKTKANIY
jgi:hypothetical protein